MRRDRLRRLPGVTDVIVDARLRNGRWRAPVRGVIVRDAGPPSPITMMTAAVLTQQQPVHISHVSAARLWDLLLPAAAPDGVHPVELTVSRDATTSLRRGVRLYRAAVHPLDGTFTTGLPCTTVARTVLDLRRHSLSRSAALVMADDALARGLCTLADLAAATARLARLRGVIAARELVRLADGRSRSPAETRLRLLLLDADLPAPVPNWVLRDDWGVVLAIGDLVYPLLLLWIEYDGYAVHTQRAVFRSDRTRERMLRARGWEVIRLVDTDLQHPERMARLIARFLMQAPGRIRSLPAGLSPEVTVAQDALDAP